MRDTHDMDSNTDYLEKLGYETSDVAYGALIKWFIALLVFIGVAVVTVSILYIMWVPGVVVERQRNALPSVRTLPPAPRLQAQPVRELDDYRQKEKDALGSYGPADRAKGTVHIPISRAIEVTAVRGLPARPLSLETPDPLNMAETGGIPRAAAPSISAQQSQPARRPTAPSAAGTDKSAPHYAMPKER